MSNEARANELAALPWTYVGPVRVEEDDQVWFELRIEELPDFYLAAATAEEIYHELGPALVSFIVSYLEHGDPLPKPPVRWLFGWNDLEGKSVKTPSPTPAPGKTWVDSVPGVSGNQMAVTT